ncbi:GH10 domain-containing protein [Caenorhabditis elegans]|uniref:GH10 domain-containing protein n=1 Tax=Caenorhabditis elegans TaxID=6239 RepID=H2L279_CAEEL|nr:GH10 domain-containing protein [Caenorhabditis elegans]CCE71619.1 GH10 domain-containing protein [Caenorhabditis elegans]|eukprot:NP_001257195.1 Uncharacterized protein CELE_R09A8.9 [Caenorhabditis elegans]
MDGRKEGWMEIRQDIIQTYAENCFATIWWRDQDVRDGWLRDGSGRWTTTTF